ncbi:MAG: hypothetical protein O2968_23500, partial [Acidobacteria bacterium]|nr:hypothetical protein [Acidobacteriota bacterium]
LQDHLVLETLPPFRIILHWTTLTPTDHLSFLGQSGDKAVIGDWNDDGLDEIGIFRNGMWLLDMNRNGTWNPGVDSLNFLGQAGDTPVVGLW